MSPFALSLQERRRGRKQDAVGSRKGRVGGGHLWPTLRYTPYYAGE